MSYKINRLEKRKSSDNEDEIFIHITVNDDLGVYQYGGWVHPEDVDAIHAEMGEPNFSAWSRLGEFKFLLPNGSTALSAYIEEILPLARQQQEDSLIEKQIDQAKRLREAQGG